MRTRHDTGSYFSFSDFFFRTAIVTNVKMPKTMSNNVCAPMTRFANAVALTLNWVVSQWVGI